MSDIKEVHGKLRLYVSVNVLLEYGRQVARLQPRSQGTLSTSIRLVTCLSIPTEAAQRVGPQLNFVNTTL